MAAPRLRVIPAGTALVTVTRRGAPLPLYSDAGLTTLVSQPATITSTTTWYVSDAGRAEVTSVDLGGAPLASSMVHVDVDVVQSVQLPVPKAPVLADAYDAYTVMASGPDNSPAPVSVPEGTLVGRAVGGSVAALTLAQALGMSTGIAGLGHSQVATDGTDQTSVLQAEIDALMAAGGGTLTLPEGTITLDGTLTMVNDAATPPKQAPLRLVGAGGVHFSGRDTITPTGGTILDIKGTDTYGKVKTNGLGLLSISGVTFKDSAGTTTPFVYTTNTTLHISGCAFYGSKTGLSCDQDAIVAGGTLAVEGAGGWLDGFQGYGTVISGNYFAGIRRAIYGRTFFNANVIRDNNIWRTCGHATGGAIEIDGDPTDVHVAVAVGNVVADNLIEGTYYRYGIVLRNASANTVRGNSVFDATATTHAGVWLDKAAQNFVESGHVPLPAVPVAGASMVGTVNFPTVIQGPAFDFGENPAHFRRPVKAMGNSGRGPYSISGDGYTAYMRAQAGVHPITRVFISTIAPAQVTDGVTVSGSAVLTSATAAFTSTDMGLVVSGAGIPADTFISSVTSATSVEMSNEATISATGVTVNIGRDGSGVDQLEINNYHLVHRGAAAVPTVSAAAGVGATASITGVDGAGKITLTTGTGATAGEQLRVTNQTWSGTAHPVISPANAAAATAGGWWVQRLSSTVWALHCVNVPPSSTALTFEYHNAQGA